MKDVNTLDGEFKRELTIERIYLSRPMTYAIMAFKVNEIISVEQLRTALSKLDIKHRFLKVKVVLEDNRKAYFTSKNVPDHEIKTQNIKLESEWAKEIENQHMTLFDVFSEPLIRFSLIYFQNFTYLIITSHHSISDGISLLTLGYDILQFVSDPSIQFKAEIIPPVINSDLVGKKFGTSSIRFLLKIINRIWKLSKHEFQMKPNDLKLIHDLYWKSDKQCRCIAWELNEGQTKKFMEKCKYEKVTVHSGLATALLLAQLKVMGDAEPYLRDFHMPINIRNRMRVPISDILSFFAISIIMSHKLSLERPFWDNARLLHTQIQKIMANPEFWRLFTVNLIDPNLLDSVYFYKYSLFDSKISRLISKQMMPKKFVASLALTNLGKVKFNPNLGKFKIDAIYGPSVYSDVLEKIFSACTINDKIFFTLTFEQKGISSEIVEKIIENMNKYINQ